MRNGDYELVIAPVEYPGMKYRGRYAYEHHVVYWETHGVVPGPGEVIHHLNEEKRDNRAENLQLLQRAEHNKHHGAERRVPDAEAFCAWCHQIFRARPNNMRQRLKASKGKVFCGRSCQVKEQQSALRLRRKTISM